MFRNEIKATIIIFLLPIFAMAQIASIDDDLSSVLETEEYTYPSTAHGDPISTDPVKGWPECEVPDEVRIEKEKNVEYIIWDNPTNDEFEIQYQNANGERYDRTYTTTASKYIINTSLRDKYDEVSIRRVCREEQKVFYSDWVNVVYSFMGGGNDCTCTELVQFDSNPQYFRDGDCLFYKVDDCSESDEMYKFILYTQDGVYKSNSTSTSGKIEFPSNEAITNFTAVLSASEGGWCKTLFFENVEFDLNDYGLINTCSDEFAEMCFLNQEFKAFNDNGNLLLKAPEVDNQEINNYISDLNISQLKLNVFGSTNSGTIINESITVYDGGYFDMSSWEHTLYGMGDASEIYVVLDIYYNNNVDLYSCSAAIEVEVSAIPDVCEIFEYLLATTQSGSNSLLLDFNDLANPNYFDNVLNQLGLNEAAFDYEMQQNYSQVIGTISYSNNGPYSQLSQNYPIDSEFSIRNFAMLFSVQDAANITANLSLDFIAADGSIVAECFYHPLNIVEEEIPDEDPSGGDLGSLLCDPDAKNATITNWTLLDNALIVVGNVYTINDIPFLLTSIKSGTNQTGFEGTGIVTLPFQDKSLQIDLSSIQINTEFQVISGKASGVKCTSGFDPSSLPTNTTLFGGDICKDPPEKKPIGIDPETGTDGFGFGEDGKHYLTGEPWDPGGFDVNGIHQDTGQPWNEEGCTRDGVHHETGEPCDPYGGTPPELPGFINDVKIDLPALLDSLLNEEKLEKQSKLEDCDSKRTELENINTYDTNDVFGPNNELIDENMAGFFEENPNEFANAVGTRNQNALTQEKKHIELLQCRIENSKLNEQIAILQTEIESLDDEQLANYIEAQLKELDAAVFEEIKNDYSKYRKWVLQRVIEYLKQNHSDYALVNDPVKNNLNYDEFKSYSRVASNDKEFIDGEDDLMSEMLFLYEQGRKNVMGYPSAIITEAIVKNRDLLGGCDEQTLPFGMTQDDNKYEYTIYIEDILIEPMGGTLNASLVIHDKVNDSYLSFAHTAIPFNLGGLGSTDGKLYLHNEAEIKISNTAKITLSASQDSTYVLWNCDGIKEFAIGGRLEFCTNYLIGYDIEKEEVKPDSIYALHFKTTFQDWLDFTVDIPKSDGFYIKGAKDYIWSVGSLSIDASNKMNIGAVDVPLGYESPHYNNGFENSWKGFVLKDLKVRFPKSFKKGGNPLEIVVNNLLIDDTGVSAHISGNNILNFSEGDLDGWGVSVENLHLYILQNHFNGGGIGGKIGVPIFDGPLSYSASILSNDIIHMSVGLTEDQKIPMWIADAKIKKNSKVDVIYKNNKAEAIATLNGSIQFRSDTTLIGKLGSLPAVRFSKLRVSNYDLNPNTSENEYFDVGTWGIDKGNLFEQIEGTSIFGITIDSIYLRNNGLNQTSLGLAVSAELVDSVLWAAGGLNIDGGLEFVNGNRHSWKNLGVSMDHFCIGTGSKIKEVADIEGCLQWFDDPVYGSGFRGGLNVKFGTFGIEDDGSGISVAGQFGKPEDGDKYFFLDALVDIPMKSKAKAAPFMITGVGLGLSKNMERVQGLPTSPPIVGFDASNYLSYPVGTTVTGWQYTPSDNIGWIIKAIVGYSIKSGLVTGTGELAVAFDKKGALDNIELRATGVLLKGVTAGDSPFTSNFVQTVTDVSDKLSQVSGIDINKYTNIDSLPNLNLDESLYAWVFTQVNFQRPPFLHGKLAVYLDTPVLYGGGDNKELVWAELYIGNPDFYLYVGRPEQNQRCEIKLNLGIVSADLSAYLDIGTKVPPFPGLPDYMKDMGRDIRIDENVRSSGLGFAFGASFDFKMDFEVLKSGLFARIASGFDMMIRKYEDVQCLQDDGSTKEIGINGYYAQGQLWSLIQARAKVAGWTIVGVTSKSILQIAAMKPTYIYGKIHLKVELPVVPDINVRPTVVLGEKCIPVYEEGEEFTVDLIDYFNPGNGNIVNTDMLPIVNFSIPLNKEYGIQGFDGYKTYTFEYDHDYSGVYWGESKLYCVEKYDVEDFRSVQYFPDNLLPANDSVIVKSRIIIFKNGQEFETQEKEVVLYTGNRFENIPETNVDFAYPINGMANYYRNLYNVGYIKMKAGQHYLFEDLSLLKAIFTDPDNNSFETEIQYAPDKKELTFLMNPSNFELGEFYKLEIFKTQEIQDQQFQPAGLKVGRSGKVLYTSYFRVSNYNDLYEKETAIIDAFQDYQFNLGITSKSDDQNRNNNEIKNDYNIIPILIDETFDYYERSKKLGKFHIGLDYNQINEFENSLFSKKFYPNPDFNPMNRYYVGADEIYLSQVEGFDYQELVAGFSSGVVKESNWRNRDYQFQKMVWASNFGALRNATTRFDDQVNDLLINIWEPVKHTEDKIDVLGVELFDIIENNKYKFQTIRGSYFEFEYKLPGHPEIFLPKALIFQRFVETNDGVEYFNNIQYLKQLLGLN